MSQTKTGSQHPIDGAEGQRPRSVLVVEDDPPTRARLKRAVKALDDAVLIDAVGTCKAARTLIATRSPDVLLTDLGLPDGSGHDLIQEFTDKYPKGVSLVVTVFADERTVIQAIEAGASGYLLKDASVDAIAAALRQLFMGGAPMSPSIARHLLKRFRPNKKAAKATKSVGRLTARETEVLGLAAKGFSFRECAELLGISPHTVTTHVRKIYKKLAVNSRAEAVYEALQLGLIDVETRTS